MNSRPRALSGFPEFLPVGRIVEQRVLDLLRHEFELHGFASLETRSVEPLSVLAGKGEIDKEVYAVRRLHADEATADELGLRYDNTVPFARYVTEFSGKLNFPFRRYQIQKVWRGERPQQGRYREFTQADIDIVGAGSLATHHDLEIPLVMLGAFARMSDELGLPPVTMHVSNRKLAEGYYRGLGITETGAVLQRIDKLDKIGPEKVAALLTDELGLAAEVADKCLALAEIRSGGVELADRVRALGVEHELLDVGLAELTEVVQTAQTYRPGRLVADLRIARGLDYYTGTVYETVLEGHPELGSICSGGRYDSLADDGKQTYPGVGISVGVSRLLGPLVADGTASASRSVPSVVLVAVTDEEQRGEALAVAAALRANDIATEVAPRADRFGKQIRYAERRGIPFVWFGTDQVKDIRSGEQVQADPTRWEPPAADRTATVKLG
ncbi:histidine--tRNA ligase [Naumannella halotolerans]|uniref:Histidine--tRNA ligase n=1 Tax=Naumannella halotolerans TaxID=993414 RepID=A0A4R7J7R3_9ACTN|nr:histidine--tRNA ligase [Naumannella halotolerans]TDT33500.1 histidyl-tRNA synthetase [Naumannella halotolerans]